jgi:xylan 1,4-beta-xylosidase
MARFPETTKVKVFPVCMIPMNVRTTALAACLALHSAGWIRAEENAPATAPAKAPSRLDIAVDTGKDIGPCHRFWTTRVLTDQAEFNNPRFLNAFKAEHPYTRSINCVRVLGGRADRLNEWFQGTHPDGSIKADFSPLMPQLHALVEADITPRIVLDNVPWTMSRDRTVNEYGNSNPPDDSKQWHAYITAFAKALVAEFGIDRVKSWRFRVGTEPDLRPGHWTGTREQYFQHYAVTVDAITRIIPDADIGPGNILNPSKPPPGGKKHATELTGDGKGWGITLIDHLAETKTRATFFGISHYSHVGQPIQIEDSIRRVRERLDRHPSLKNIPFDIQEFGVLSDENKQRLHGGEASEWAASWYAAVADIAYRNGIHEIYDWGYSAADLPIPRQLVMGMLERMAGGQRLELTTKGSRTGNSGAIAVKKDSSIYLLLYHHQDPRQSKARQALAITLKGPAVESSPKWTWDEWTVDRDHGSWLHEFYQDCEKAGVKLLPNAPNFGVHFHKRFADGWRPVFKQNLAKYRKLAQLQQTVTARPATTTGGTLHMEFVIPAHTVKLIKLDAVSSP